jgi:hypothetical protein
MFDYYKSIKDGRIYQNQFKTFCKDQNKYVENSKDLTTGERSTNELAKISLINISNNEVEIKMTKTTTKMIPFIVRKDFEYFTINYKIVSITNKTFEKEKVTEKEESREFLTTYLKGIVKILLPEETETKKVYKKLMLEKRETKSWFKVNGAYI